MSLNTVQWLDKLVAFDTTSRNSNLELIECIRGFLEDICGLKTVIVQKSDDGIHANLWATLPGAGGVTKGGIILSGHTDVVPVDGQKWDTDPFKLSEKDGKLYGRGTCDMKGFIAICLALTPELLTMNRRKPIHLAFTYNEEVDFAGIRQLVSDSGIPLGGAEGCIIGEPTLLRQIIGHKGIQSALVHVRGKAAHSSLTTHGCNAIEYASDVVAFLRNLSKEFKENGPFHKGYEPPCTTVCPTIIEGGNAVNTVPAECTIQYEFRNIPAMPQNEVIKRMQEYVASLSEKMKKEDPDSGAELELVNSQEAFSGNAQCQVFLAIQTASGEHQDGMFLSGCTEAPDYESKGIHTIVWGPGDIAMAHKPNEYVDLEGLTKAAHILIKSLEILTAAVKTTSQL